VSIKKNQVNSFFQFFSTYKYGQLQPPDDFIAFLSNFGEDTDIFKVFPVLLFLINSSIQSNETSSNHISSLTLESSKKSSIVTFSKDQTFHTIKSDKVLSIDISNLHLTVQIKSKNQAG